MSENVPNQPAQSTTFERPSVLQSVVPDETQFVAVTPDGQQVEVIPMGPKPLVPDREPWEKQPHEKAKEYAAFLEYLQLPPNIRSVARAYFVATGKYRPEGAPHLWTDTAILWSWEARADAFDQRLTKLFLTSLEAERVRSRWRMAKLGRRMQEKALDAIESVRATGKDSKGNDVAILTPTEITKLAEAGARIERLALDLSTENVEQHTTVHHQEDVDKELLERAKRIIEDRERDLTEPAK